VNDIRPISLILILLLAACAARQTTPVALSQPGDAALSCKQLDDEFAHNEAEAIRLVGADENVVLRNIAVGVLSVWLIDLSNVEQIQFRALRDRNDNLVRIREQRGC